MIDPVLANRIGKVTRGVATAVLAPDAAPSAQLLGTVHARRGRWNPFLPDNDMRADGTAFVAEVDLRAHGGRHGDGVYAFRFITNHVLCNCFKADQSKVDADGKPALVFGESADQAQNVLIQVPHDGTYTIRFDPATKDYSVSPKPVYLSAVTSMQLNGFVWDSEDMFEKFQERRPNHAMVRNGDWFEITVPLKKNGGIFFRADGVYQFLFSANGNEDWGFAACNFGPNRLTGGTGFGSSGGHRRHSALTIRIVEDGLYTFRANPFTYHYDIIPPAGVAKPQSLNVLNSVQLLGTIWPEGAFNPTDPKHTMQDAGNGRVQLAVPLEPGPYTVNFVFSRELFLDSMALGAWLAKDDPSGAIHGRAWHGKPNETNVTFEVTKKGRFTFTYDTTDDTFSIAPEAEAAVKPRATIDSLQIVGDFSAPLKSWDPTSELNDLIRVGEHVFTRDIYLEAGRTYHYKYSANHLPWLWVFADYELDGFGRDFSGSNPHPTTSRFEDLIRFGQLTTHGDPPALEFHCKHSGHYQFTADLDTGAYAVQPVSLASAPPSIRTSTSRITMSTSDSHLAFFEAVKYNHVSLVDQALADGFNPNIRDPSGRTPLMYAAARGHAYIVRVLVGSGADVNVLCNRFGNSVLHYACQNGTAAVAQTLIGHGAHINLQCASQGHSPLLDAIIYKNVGVTKVLLDAGANLNAKNNWGWGPAEFIEFLSKQPGTEKERITAIKVAWDARVAADTAKKASMQLFQAVLAGDVEKVKARIAAGDDLDATWPVEQGGNDGHTALIAAARDGKAEITALLVEAGADPYAVDSLYKALALHKSSYMGNPASLAPQVDAQLDLDIQGPWQGFTPLHDSIWQGHPDCAEILIKGGADVTLEAVTGQTPLDLAIATFGGNHAIVHLLHEKMMAGE